MLSDHQSCIDKNKAEIEVISDAQVDLTIYDIKSYIASYAVNPTNNPDIQFSFDRRLVNTYLK